MTPVWSLTRNEPRYLPTAFCFYDYPVFPEAAYCIACSNGNAPATRLKRPSCRLSRAGGADSVALCGTAGSAAGSRSRQLR